MKSASFRNNKKIIGKAASESKKEYKVGSNFDWQ